MQPRKKPAAIAVKLAVQQMAINAATIREIEEKLRLMQTTGFSRWEPVMCPKPRVTHLKSI